MPLGTRSLFRTVCRVVGSSGLAAIAALALAAPGTPTWPCSVAAAAGLPGVSGEGQDKLIMKDGRVIAGTIVSETSTQVSFRGEVAGIAYETVYEKSNILEIRRAEKPKDAGAAKPAAAPAVAEEKPRPSPGASEADAGGPKVAIIELTGEFGRDISETPMRDAVKDAQKRGADVVVFAIENDWSWSPEIESEKGDDEAEFDRFARAEDMDMIYSEEMARWDNPPRVVFWVKKAMGGAAFLPLACKEVYFSSEGRMGGIGNLGELLKGVGDDAVQEKQRSLRLARAEGMCRTGGHPLEIIRAMAIKKYVLSASFDGGRVVFFERMPESPGEILLTDDAAGENQDTQAAIAAGEGNDVLTLNAKLARDVGLSRGTADDVPGLLFAMDLPRTATVIDSRSKQIMKGWSEAVDRAERDIRRLWQEYGEVQPGATFEERTKARGLRKKKLNDISNILNRYGEAFGKREVEQFRAQIRDGINAIDTEQQRDYQLNRKK